MKGVYSKSSGRARVTRIVSGKTSGPTRIASGLMSGRLAARFAPASRLRQWQLLLGQTAS